MKISKNYDFSGWVKNTNQTAIWPVTRDQRDFELGCEICY
jgi:hypothetical protein